MLDFTIGVGVRTYFNDIREREIAPGASITEEGQALVLVPDGLGGIAVQPCKGTSSEIFCGFAITDALKIATNVDVETFNIPAVAPYQVTLQNQNIILGATPGGDLYVYDHTAGAPLTFNTLPLASTQYNLTSAGLMTFDAAQANDNVTVQYRYNLTLAQTIDQFHQRSVNNFAQDYFSSVSVGCMDGEVFTTQYDTSVAYVAGGKIYTGGTTLNANDEDGNVTSATTTTLVGYCTQLPSTTSQFLGVKFRTID